MKKLLLSCLAVTLSSGLFAQTSLTTAVDFTVTDVHGNQHTLFDILAGGQHVLIDFFFTTCPPCIQYQPDINQAHADYGCNTGDVFFFSIDAGDNTAEVLQYESDHNGQHPAISGTDGGGDAVVSAYGISAFPTVILIAPNHDVVVQDIWPPSTANLTSAMTDNGIQEQACTSTGIEDFDLSTTAIAGTYPNPAVNESKMDFTVSVSAKVEFEIYNLLGSKVAAVKAEQFKAGLHTVDLPVAKLAPGNYFVNMIVEETRVDVQKFSVIR